MATLPPGENSETSQRPAKESLTKVPLWIPISAFVGTSLALAIPLLMLRKSGGARRVSLKGSVAPPLRNAHAGARIPQPTASAAASSSEPVVTSLREEIETPSAGEMMSALARMNASSALMAAKAFGIATALVVAGGCGLAWTVRATMDVHDVRGFGLKMRYFMWKSLPSLTSRIHRAPESEDERRQLDHVASSVGEEWSWDKAQRRLEAAYNEGGFPLWAQMAMREVEAEARLERAKRESQFKNA